jgi:hypothetical protein
MSTPLQEKPWEQFNEKFVSIKEYFTFGEISS